MEARQRVGTSPNCERASGAAVSDLASTFISSRHLEAPPTSASSSFTLCDHLAPAELQTSNFCTRATNTSHLVRSTRTRSIIMIDLVALQMARPTNTRTVTQMKCWRRGTSAFVIGDPQLASARELNVRARTSDEPEVARNKLQHFAGCHFDLLPTETCSLRAKLKPKLSNRQGRDEVAAQTKQMTMTIRHENRDNN